MPAPLSAVRRFTQVGTQTPGFARRLLRTHCQDVLADSTLDTAELLVSELVTNAVVHAGPPLKLEISCADGEQIRVVLVDGSAREPERRNPDTGDDHGRGLQLVGLLSSSWGCEPRQDGKAVWFELQEPSAS